MENKMVENPNWKKLVFLFGGFAGLLIGLVAAHLIIRKREQSEGELKLTSGEGVKIGLGVVSLLKLISESGSK
jgi:hypothetical protein